MKRTVSETELSVLKILWRDGPSTARDIGERLGRDHKATTVLTLLRRLEEKDCVEVDRSLQPHTFRATKTRDRLVVELLKGVATDLFDGIESEMVKTFVRKQGFSKDQIREFRSLLDDLEKRRPKDSPPERGS